MRIQPAHVALRLYLSRMRQPIQRPTAEDEGDFPAALDPSAGRRRCGECVQPRRGASVRHQRNSIGRYDKDRDRGDVPADVSSVSLASISNILMLISMMSNQRYSSVIPYTYSKSPSPPKSVCMSNSVTCSSCHSLRKGSSSCISCDPTYRKSSIDRPVYNASCI